MSFMKIELIQLHKKEKTNKKPDTPSFNMIQPNSELEERSDTAGNLTQRTIFKGER